MTHAASMDVVTPRSASEVRAAMQDAIAANSPIRIRGADTWRDAGPPIISDRTLSLRELSGIIEYVPGDLTLTALAGTSLAELSHATAAHGQWLGLDPAGDRLGTIGATIATASSGPLAHAFGTPRDIVLGLEAVTGYGDLVTPGGRVVKNVAGFDLVRLFTGSYGTLGIITMVSLRLRALPVHDVTLALAADDHARFDALLMKLRQNDVSLLACEWIDGATARRLGVSDGTDVILARIGGNDRFVRGQEAALRAVASCTACEPDVWGALASLDADATAVVRFSGAVSDLPSRIAKLRADLAPLGTTAAMHASVGRGVVRVIISANADAVRETLQTTTAGLQRIPERLPTAWWSREPDPFAGGLASRIRSAFDPQLLCNRRKIPDA